MLILTKTEKTPSERLMLFDEHFAPSIMAMSLRTSSYVIATILVTITVANSISRKEKQAVCPKPKNNLLKFLKLMNYKQKQKKHLLRP